MIKQAFLLVFWGGILLTPFLSATASEKELQVIAGAGPSTKIATRFFKLFSETEAAKPYKFKVPTKSIKHKGGLYHANNFLFGRTGRPLSPLEKEKGYQEIFLSKTPVVVVKGNNAGVESLSLNQVCGIFQGKFKNWKEVGGRDHAIVVFSREPTESIFTLLKQKIPCFQKTIPTPFVFRKDHQLMYAIKNLEEGERAIGFGALPNFDPKRVLKIPELSVGILNGLVYLKKNKDHPLVHAVKKFAQSDKWHQELAKMGLTPP